MFKWEQVVDTKGVIRSSKSKDIQHKGQAKNRKMTNNDPQITTKKTKDRAIFSVYLVMFCSRKLKKKSKLR
jgi:hypothetical protein